MAPARPRPLRPHALALAAILATAAPSAAQGPAGAPVDLTHAFDEDAVYWPTAPPFRLTVEAEGPTEAGWWYAANSFCAAEHGGTHLDAPIHFAEGRQSAAEVPLDRLMGPAAVVDVRDAAERDPDLLVGVEAFRAWEAEHGRLEPGAIVLIRTGWGARWPDAERYLGTAERGPDAVPDLHFPGLHEEAARWLVEERDVGAIGIDTASIDRGQSADFRAHRVLAAADVPIFENVANLHRVPPTGAWTIALPMKVAGGTGGPLRIVAFVEGTE
ncbi:MAG: cyclase family protein [Gemmatimonadota bacterium]|nr:cyclase family protein [Gemmatimonadota bacterium]